jgi:hypothetical protein
MAIPDINVLGNPNVTEGNFQIAIEDLRKSVIGSGKAYDSANTYSQYDTCVYNGVVYYSKVNSNIGNTPAVNAKWGLIGDLITGIVHNIGNESIAGIKTFTSSPIVPVPTLANQAISMGNIIEKTPVGIGYGTGSGGTVTQLTSKGTAVTLNKPTGKIIMNDAALANSGYVGFLFNNNSISPNDTICVNPSGGAIDISAYRVRAVYYSTNAAAIYVENISGGSLSDALQINFTILKGANS